MKVLVVSAHPDDEVLGCGATIAKHSANGDPVRILIMSEGVTSRGGDVQSLNKEIEERKAMAKEASKVLGVQRLSFGDLKDQVLDNIPLIMLCKLIESQLEYFKPDIVYTHCGECLNQDHRRVHEAVKVACRPPTGVKKILFFSIPSSTEWDMPAKFSPDYFVDTTEFIQKKIEALRSYDFEMRPFPHSRSYEAISHLGSWWGASVGVRSAEAFKVGRIIN